MKKPVIALALAVLLSARLSPLAATNRDIDASARPFYVVVHLDVEPKALATALPFVQAYGRQALRDPRILHVDILQQTNAANHFTFVEVLRSEQAYRDFAEEPYVKAMRAGLQPYLGAPFDERYHQAMATQ